MKRRDPTRIELKLDDIQEFEQMKRQLEMHKNNSKNGGGTEDKNLDIEAQGESASGQIPRTEIVHRRIGYDPQPKMS